MQSETFRFLVTRPVQRRQESGRLIRVDSAFVRTLDADPARRRKAADTFVGGASFAATLDRLTTPLATLDRWLLANPTPTRAALDAQITEVFRMDAGQLVSDDAFGKNADALRDSLAAATLATTAPPGDRIVRGLRLVTLIERLAGGDPTLEQPAGIAAALRARVLLPRSHLKASAAVVPPEPEVKKPPTKVTRDAISHAIGELRTLYGSELARRRISEVPATSEPEVEKSPTQDPSELIQRAVGELRGLLRDVLATRGVAGTGQPRFGSRSAGTRKVLPGAATSRLSEQTKELLKELRVPLDRLHVPSTIRLLEGQRASRASVIATPRTAFRLGNTTVALSGQSGPGRSLGQVSGGVPRTAGRVRPSGVGELQIVRQTLKRYELGEIAHIENVLRGEQHERTFRRSRTSETFTLVEQEHAETSERDLQSTERFELQNEAKETIKEALSLQTGFQLSASYGPTVSVGISAAGSYELASEKSSQTSTDYAREIVEQSASRLMDRTLERRGTRAVDETQEVAQHAVDNSASPTGHVVGVYRWVDKLYQAQVVNYGKRTMFEFVIPEPAAFYRLAPNGQSLPGTLEAPVPPTVEGDTSSSPLSPMDIDEDNYDDLVARYGAEGVEPPPPVYLVVGITLERPAGDQSRTTKTSTELRVPAGYRAVSADVTYSVGGSVDRDFWLLIGDQSFSRGGAQEFALNGERDVVPVALSTKGVEALVATIQVDCERTEEHFATWQLRTFAAVMAGYQKQKIAYDEAVAAAQIQEGTQITGRNPAANQEIIRNELKKSALSLLTAQHFDLFDAVRQEPEGYPQLDVDEALLEGPYIQFFEQAFEWQNLTYVFYPYFWGRKQEWPVVSRLDDVDPLMGQFLRAGAARVQTPLRPGFEEAMAYFLEFGQPWNGLDPPLVDDELYVALTEEVRGQSGVSFVDGPGTVSVTQGATTLTGAGTAFTDNDKDREIRVGGRDLIIASVESETNVTLTAPHPGPDVQNARYALGPRLVGLPWDVRVPTTLVMLQSDATLPSFDG
jgi:hypothetical protein